MTLKKLLLLCLTIILLMTMTACSQSDPVLDRARAAWDVCMGSKTPDSTTAISHIRFTSLSELGKALGIDTARTSFASSGLFAQSGHLFGIMHENKPRYVVATDDDGKVTWVFNIQTWKTIKGSDRVSSLEFSMLATAVANGVKAVYPQNSSVPDNVWHRLTPEQISKLAE